MAWIAYPGGINSKEGERDVELGRFNNVTICAVFLRTGPSSLASRFTVVGLDVLYTVRQVNDMTVFTVLVFGYRQLFT